ncbi:MAG: B12-binding domain-containing radical SAM protein [Myxococcales bacterium]|nr:B12-binding domain-containing radical SAM protein [Myxococcales bacterium]
MRILLAHPAFPITYWGFQHALPIIAKRATLPPLGLITVAAHLPASAEVRLIDLAVTPLDDAALAWADVVLIGGMRIQLPSMLELIARARRLGRRTIVGGPAATTAPDDLAAADVVFCGEVEGRDDELWQAITGVTDGVVPAPSARPALAQTRLPRYDLLDLTAYASMSVQYSRGCPFRCEFCDVIEIFGRVPRVKAPAQVLAELDALDQLGWRGTVFLVDDNFIGNRREVATLLPALTAWQVAHDWPLALYTEASVDLAGEPDLVRGMVGAGFGAVFLGIETPSEEALRGVGKTQNLRMAPAEAVAILARGGLEVMSGFIVGFDSDDLSALAAQRRFLAAAPIPLAMVGLLTALPGTALWRRLAQAGRLRTSGGGDQYAHTNFVPIMDERALLTGYADLLAEIYSPDAYLARCLAHLALAPTPTARVRAGGARIAARAVWQLGVRGGRRRQFWQLLGAAIRKSPAFTSWAIEKAIQGEHLIRYTAEQVVPRIRAAAEAIPRPTEVAVDLPVPPGPRDRARPRPAPTA